MKRMNAVMPCTAVSSVPKADAMWLPQFADHLMHALMPWCGVLLGFYGPLSVEAHRREAYLWGEITFYLATAGMVGITLWWWRGSHDQQGWLGWLWLIATFIGLGLVFVWFRYGLPAADECRARLTRRSRLVRPGRTDVRTVAQELPAPSQAYDPREFYRYGDYFMGVDEHARPIYWGGSLPHVSISGTSGAGKGRKLQDLAAQAILNDEAVFYCDPKDDEWGPHALFTACMEHGKPHHHLRLLPDALPQIQLVAGATAWEIEELLHAGLGLADVGAGSDFYRAKDRKAAKQAATWAAECNLTLAEVHRLMADDHYWQEEAPGFIQKLGEIAGVKAVNAPVGAFTLADVVSEGGGVYIVGSMTLQGVKRAMQMLFVRIQQIATARDRMKGKLRTVCVIADEAKYHLSRPVLQGLGASRDKGMRVVLAFQSFDDLKDCPADLNPDMVVGAIMENTPCKMVYRLEDPVTADWVARKSGTVLVDDETRVVQTNVSWSELSEPGRSVRQAEHFLFDANKLMNMPTGWCVLFGKGVAQACHVSPYRVAKSQVAITPSVAAVGGTQSRAGGPAHLADELADERVDDLAHSALALAQQGNARKKVVATDNHFFRME